MPRKDYYQILGIAPQSGKEEIKQAFRKLALEIHPDVAEDKAEAEIRFREINEAYQVLSDEEKRAFYDRYGYVEGEIRTPDFSSLFNFGFEDFLEGFFGFSGSRGPRKGADLGSEILISLEEAYSGVEKTLPYTRWVNCSHCQGSGKKPGTDYKTCQGCGGTGQIHRVQHSFIGQIMQSYICPECQGQGVLITHPCPECRGKRKLLKEEKLVVNIPAGISHGDRLRVPQAGEAGEAGSPPGDFYLSLGINEHAVFQRRGKDLQMEQVISFTCATLGGDLKIKTLDGMETPLTIHAGSQNGDILVLKGKGMPQINSKKIGDLMVKIKIEVPKKITPRQKEILEEFAKIEGENREDKGFFDRLKNAFN